MFACYTPFIMAFLVSMLRVIERLTAYMLNHRVRYHSLGALMLIVILTACSTAGATRHPTPMPLSATSTSISSNSPEAAYLDQLAVTGALTGSVLIARGGTVLVSKGYGLADEASNTPNTAQMRFRIGSITKQFTAMAILILQERGKLHVLDHLCAYITACPRAWQPITLQQLLTHTSGIPDYTNFADFPALIGTPATPDQLIDRFKNMPLAFTPGAKWSYSNSGYVLLGAIIEKVAGESYATFLQQNIFDPLHMQNSGYDSNAPQLPAHATGYLSTGNEPVFLDMSEFYAAGALYSTVEDLYRWDQALMNATLVSRQSLTAMFTVYIPCPTGGCALDTDIGYGYGWFIAREAGDTLIYHWGRIDGFRASNGFFADRDIIVIVLSNLETTDVWGISRHLADMLVTS